MKVNLLNRSDRKKRFSIEKVFQIVSQYYSKEIVVNQVKAKSSSASLTGILLNIFQKIPAADINHITGDVHYILLLKKRRNAILTIHDCIRIRSLRFIKRWLYQLIWFRLPVKHARYITAISEITKRDIVKYTGCRPDKITVIHDPIRPEFHYFPSSFNQNKPTILQIGTNYNKNVDRLIVALRGIHCSLHIIGHLSEKQRLLLTEHDIEYVNEFELSDIQIHNAYKNCDMVTFISTEEGFGMPIIEAQAIGRVVITSNIEPLAEVSGSAACIVDPYDIKSIREGIVKVIHEEELRDALISEGLRNVERFDPRIIAAKYEGIYKKASLNSN